MTTPLDINKMIPLITGGGSGIGWGFAEEFLKAGAPKVIITGRRLAVLEEAASKYPGKVFFKVSDAGSEKDRQELLEWIEKEHPDCNALINNAGIQRRIPLVEDTAPWADRETEIQINLAGPIHLCTIFTPFFLAKGPETTLVANVTSGLAFVPFVAGPVYAATKAAIHSYTMSLRYSLEDTNLRVVEIVPPAVKSNLGGSHDFGEELDEYCADAFNKLMAGEPEMGFKFSDMARQADRVTIDGAMVRLAEIMNIPKYPANT